MFDFKAMIMRELDSLSFAGYPATFPIRAVNAMALSQRALVRGVGVNDAPYLTQPTVGGRLVKCPAYSVWENMLKRCYDPAVAKRQPAYIGCTVCEEWHSFMSFRAWLTQHPDWQNRQVDKDILYPGNKVYSPGTCLLVPAAINTLFTSGGTRQPHNAALPTGVFPHGQRYTASLSVGGKPLHIGRYKTPEEAAAAYRAAKLDYALCLAFDYLDEPRLFDAIIDNAALVYGAA